MTAPDRLSALAKALAHPARVRILQTLGARGACVCGAVVDEIGLAQSTVSQHLKVLREAGLVRGTVEGTSTCYCLDAAGVSDARTALASLLDSLAACCADGDCGC